MTNLTIDRFLADIPDRPVQDPARELKIGGALIGVFVVGGLAWASLARLDAAVQAPAVVRVSGDRQVVQTPSGGVISAIRVHEGDTVRAGQVLVAFATTEALAQERSLASRVIGLQAEIARINAELAGSNRVPAPAAFAELDDAHAEIARAALALEQAELDARHTLGRSERATLQQRFAQIGHQIDGFQQRQVSNAQQAKLSRDELGTYETLLSKGLSTMPRVLAMRRSVAAIDGESGATAAEIARLHTVAGETRMQMIQLDSQRLQQNAERLRAAQTELQTVEPQWQAARQQLERTNIRAPMAGTVNGLAIRTLGAVAAPGAKLMEIVPSQGPVIVEAQVALDDANDLRPGQKAEVKLSSLHGRNLPPLAGVVARVSADSFTDERTGRSYYTATVTVPRAELARGSRLAGLDGLVRAGTPVQVTVPVRPRSALDYMTGPLMLRTTTVFHER